MVRGRKKKLVVFLAVMLMACAAFASYLFRVLVPHPDQKLEVTQDRLAKLAALRDKRKYVELPGTNYIGLRPEPDRQRAELQMNALIDRLRDGLAANPSKKFVLGEFRITLDEFEPGDTEDREQLLRYLESIMDILGIASSNGLLSRWMYGPILGPVFDRISQPQPTHS